jgi:hypothetical protein
MLRRDELYLQPYNTVDWNKARNQLAPEDARVPHTLLQDCIMWGLSKAEHLMKVNGPLRWLRNRALKEVLMQVKAEDTNTHYLTMGPVSKSLHMLCRWFDDPKGLGFRRCA